LADKVVLVGRVPHSEVPRYYDLVDIFAYPRKRMRLTDLVTPLKPLEAMASGRLVVASDVGGHRELIRDGETGVLFAADDVGDLARKLIDLIRDPDRWQPMRQAARRFVEQERTWDRSVARYGPVYAGLVK
jgi:glycosyltransferase involved in cell wall biosynthesis